ncbi:MAG: hypothetical protein KGJ06_06975 [Pseudomonadota bacterium]|nr:hypothetical protein [Pseudomonadota bacterium]
MTEQFANNASSTLNGAITAGAISLTVVSAGSFPVSGNFRIIIDSEIFLVTAVSGSVFTVTPGYEGTTQASHASGATVTHVCTAGVMSDITTKLKRDIIFNLDGNGSAIQSGGTWYLSHIPYAGTITGWNLVADQSGSIVIDVWKASAAMPTVSNTITASSLPTLSAAQSAFSGSVSGWTTSISAGDVMAFHVNSASSVQKVNLTLQVTL